MQVQRGNIRRTAGANLTGKEAYLAFLTHDTGVPRVRLPASNDEIPTYLIVAGGAQGEDVDLMPLDVAAILSVKLKGTCNPGAPLVLADVATPADAGKVRTLPTTPGVYPVLAIADEVGVDGQIVRARPCLYLARVASEAVAELDGDTGGTADGELDDVSTAVTGVDGTDSNAASKADVDAALVKIANNEAELAARLAAVLALLQAQGLMAAE